MNDCIKIYEWSDSFSVMKYMKFNKELGDIVGVFGVCICIHI